MTSKMVADYLIDCLGYSDDDLAGHTISELYDMLSPEQVAELKVWCDGGNI